MNRKTALTACVAGILLLLPITLLAANSPAANSQPATSIARATWSNWGASQHALADDGDSIWIGATGSVLQWDKASGDTQRYGPAFGLRHRRVRAVAVDSAGNVWFGGDAGLSRRDPAGIWTHYNAANSPLPVDNVAAIAVGPGDVLWLSHGLPNGPVTQWQPGGDVHRFANRAAAVEQAYAQILLTTNTNDLWTVAGSDIWTGYFVYDGAAWHARQPPGVSAAPLVVRADSAGRVYALQEQAVYRWDGSWSAYHLALDFDGFATALSIVPGDGVWVGGEERVDIPYRNRTVGITRLPEAPGTVELERQLGVLGPLSSLLGTSEGLWGIGPSWVMTPELHVVQLAETARYTNVSQAVRTADNRLFVHNFSAKPYVESILQLLDDRNTAALADDLWSDQTTIDILNAAAPTPGGGLWLAGQLGGRAQDGLPPRRLVGGQWLEYSHYPAQEIYAEAIRDIYVQSERHTWFAVDHWEDAKRGIIHLDDGGTPTDFGDDTWTRYLTPWAGESYAVAIDARGNPLIGDDSGLYRYVDGEWQRIGQKRGICDIVTAADGTIFAEFTGDRCGSPFDRNNQVYVARPDAPHETMLVPDLVAAEFERVASASHRNRLWTVAPDGAVWYLDTATEPLVARHDGEQVSYHELPFDENSLPTGPLEVDEQNRLWFANAGELWRLGPVPDFQVDNPHWLIAPGTTRTQTLSVRSVGGYRGNVTLEIQDLPAGISASLQSNPIAAGQATLVTVNAAPDVAPGVYHARLMATGATVVHPATITLTVATTVYDMYFPRIAHPGSHGPG